MCPAVVTPAGRGTARTRDSAAPRRQRKMQFALADKDLEDHGATRGKKQNQKEKIKERNGRKDLRRIIINY